MMRKKNQILTDGTHKSKVVLNYLRPYINDMWLTDDLHMVLKLATFGWNAPLMQTMQRQLRLDDLTDGMSEEHRIQAKTILLHMAARKQEFFRQYQDFILDLELIKTNEGEQYLSVIFTKSSQGQ